MGRTKWISRRTLSPFEHTTHSGRYARHRGGLIGSLQCWRRISISWGLSWQISLILERCREHRTSCRVSQKISISYRVPPHNHVIISLRSPGQGASQGLALIGSAIAGHPLAIMSLAALLASRFHGAKIALVSAAQAPSKSLRSTVGAICRLLWYGFNVDYTTPSVTTRWSGLIDPMHSIGTFTSGFSPLCAERIHL